MSRRAFFIAVLFLFFVLFFFENNTNFICVENLMLFVVFFDWEKVGWLNDTVILALRI